MKHYVQKVCDKCITCRQFKSKILLHDLYTLLPLPNESYVDIFMTLF